MRRLNVTVLAAFRALALAVTLGLVAFAAAGCGHSSASSVRRIPARTTAGTTTSADPANPMRFSACMRAHGLPNFPDPGPDSSIHLSPAIDKDSPTFQGAYRACRTLAPSPPTAQQQARLQEQLLAFAKCMRSHGVPAFPDPHVTDRGIRFPVPAGAIDPRSPIVIRAGAACRSTISGLSKDPTDDLIHGAAGTGKGK